VLTSPDPTRAPRSASTALRWVASPAQSAGTPARRALKRPSARCLSRRAASVDMMAALSFASLSISLQRHHAQGMYWWAAEKAANSSGFVALTWYTQDDVRTVSSHGRPR
jgi:hypothetical protein